MNESILIIEDEAGLVLTISDLLISEGYRIDGASDGDSGLSKAMHGEFALIILDVMLPKKTGFDVCRALRQRGVDSAILMLTAKTQVVDRVVGLKMGADDYLTKPFDTAELRARVEALLRRMHKPKRKSVHSVRFGDVEVDFERAEVKKDGQQINLAAKELRLLQYLVEHRNRVVAREEILKAVWESEGDVSSRTVDVHIVWLRQKLDDPQNPKYIQTVRSKGYGFMLKEAKAPEECNVPQETPAKCPTTRRAD
jgi:two-component system, OmpR family, alkaline phosphatase synthesis response regulator PhoP